MIQFARENPRDLKQVKKRIESHIADPEIAESMWYTLKFGRETIVGPTIRLAEILYLSWGNIGIRTWVKHRSQTHVTAEGVAIDLETNTRIGEEATTPIHGRGPDAIKTAEQRARAVCRRNLTFHIIPGSYTKLAMEKARRVYAGEDIGVKVKRMFEWFEINGVSEERVLQTIGKEEISDLTNSDIDSLRGMANKIVEQNRPVLKALEAQEDETAHQQAEDDVAPTETTASLNSLADAAGMKTLELDAKKKFGKHFKNVWAASVAVADGKEDTLRYILSAPPPTVVAALATEEPAASLLQIAQAQKKTLGT